MVYAVDAPTDAEWRRQIWVGGRRKDLLAIRVFPVGADRDWERKAPPDESPARWCGDRPQGILEVLEFRS